MISDVQERPDGRYHLSLRLLRRNGGRKIPLLRAVVAELSVIAAFDLHNVFRVVDVILHTLVEGTVL